MHEWFDIADSRIKAVFRFLGRICGRVLSGLKATCAVFVSVYPLLVTL